MFGLTVEYVPHGLAGSNWHSYHSYWCVGPETTVHVLAVNSSCPNVVLYDSRHFCGEERVETNHTIEIYHGRGVDAT